jgi:hypothetical protein
LIRLARFFGVLSLVLASSLSIGGLSPAPASTLLFDRGLPTQNLNDAAGVSRSNVAVSYAYYTSATPAYTVFGDDFSIGSLGSTYHLDKITVWTVDDSPSAYRLLGGLPGAISQVSTSAGFNAVTYLGGANYQSGSAFYPIYQVDFTVDWTIEGGKLYQFFIDAPLHDYGTLSAPAYAPPFLHASNAGLSGSPQEGADDLLLLITLAGGVPVPGSVTSYDSTVLGDWNKSSDANLQIYGTPLPGTLLLLGSGLVGLGLWRGRKRFKG